MIKIGICDDDKNIVSKIKTYINEYSKEKFIINTYNSGEELLSLNEKFDVIFLDIDMIGIDGIETAKRLRIYDKDVKIKV
ncbi:response regulator [Clostridioides difficile]